MLLRLALLPLVLAASAAAAESQQTSSADAAPPDASTLSAKSGSQAPHPRLRFGGFAVSAGYSHFSGLYPSYGYYPGYWGYSPWFYDPLLFSPIFAPGYYTGFAYQPNMGAVKIQGGDRNAWVYLDGALAGRADKLKEMWLDPGAYNFELRAGDHKVSQKIYVLSGKTLKVTPELMEARP